MVLPSIPEDSLSSLVKSIKEIITNEDGEEIASEDPFNHSLAYPMAKTVGASHYVVNDAYIGWIKFEIEPEKIETIKTAVEKLDEILRMLIIKAPRETTFTFAAAKSRTQALEEPEESREEASEAIKEVVPEVEESTPEPVVE